VTWAKGWARDYKIRKQTMIIISPSIFFRGFITGACQFESGPAAGGKLASLSVRTRTSRWLPACLHRVAVAALSLGLPIFSAAAASVFTITNVPLPGVAHSSVACGDFNGDGRPDVLLTGADASFTGVCQVWQNSSNGLFTKLSTSFPGISSSAVARGDFNNDGRADMLITGFAGLDGNNVPIYVSQVWLNNGDGTFRNIEAGLPGVDAGAVALGDYDNDGNLDILLTGYSFSGGVAQVWRNLGNGTFSKINVGLPGVFYSSVAWGDYDNDGLLDILLTGTSNGFQESAVTQLWRNQGNGSFANVNIGLPGVLQGTVAWGDFDQDGRLDILLTGAANTGPICQVWRNLGDGAFININVGLPGVYESSTALADYDNDGKLDLVLSGVDAHTNLISQVWRNKGNWVFTKLNAGLPGLRSGSVTWADFDTDGRLDLLLTGFDGGGDPVLQIFHSNTALPSTFAPRIKSLKTLDSGVSQLTFDGHIDFGYTIWASTNLIQWTALGAPNEQDRGTYRFCDPSAMNLRYRFYRLTSP
jgi:hypothetical protein